MNEVNATTPIIVTTEPVVTDVVVSQDASVSTDKKQVSIFKGIWNVISRYQIASLIIAFVLLNGVQSLLYQHQIKQLRSKIEVLVNTNTELTAANTELTNVNQMQAVEISEITAENELLVISNKELRSMVFTLRAEVAELTKEKVKDVTINSVEDKEEPKIAEPKKFRDSKILPWNWFKSKK